MGQPADVYMQWISAVGGEISRPLTDLRQQHETEATLIDDLLREGFQCYVKTQKTALELASTCLAGLEAERGRGLSDVDAIILACEDFDDLSDEVDPSKPDYRTWLSDTVTWMAAHGLEAAYPYGNWLAGCGNMTSALSLARSLVAAGVHRRVLVTIMSVFRGGENRGIRRTGSSVVSDAAACCIVTGEPDAGARYLFEATDVTADARLSTINRATDEVQYLFAFEQCVRRARTSAELMFGRSLNSFDHILVPNLPAKVLAASFDILQIPHDSPRRGRHSALAHTGAPDHFFGLKLLQSGGSVKQGNSILLFNPGPFCWDFVALTFHS